MTFHHTYNKFPEKAKAPHSSTLAWKIPGMGEPCRLQFMGSRRVRHDWATHFQFSLSCIGEGNGNPLQCSCLENPKDCGAWWAAVYGVAQSRTQLKRLSNSSRTFQDIACIFSKEDIFISTSSYDCFNHLTRNGRSIPKTSVTPLLIIVPFCFCFLRC